MTLLLITAAVVGAWLVFGDDPKLVHVPNTVPFPDVVE